MPLQPGEKLGVYEILASLEANERSELYRASDPENSREVEIRIFPSHFSERFGREAPALTALKHPNICELYEAGSHEGKDFLVFEHLQGATLAQRLEGKPIGLRDAMTMAIEIAGALDAAHSAGVVHRNLTPSKILLTGSGVKILDFGSAEATAEADVVASGTDTEVTPVPAKSGWGPAEAAALQYNAPEQFQGKDPGARADVFSFGAIFYEVLTGKQAFEGKSRAVLIAALATAEPDPIFEHRPGAPPALQHLVERCLEKDPDDRWHTHDLLMQLKWIAAGGKALAEKAPAGFNTKVVRIALATAAMFIAALAYPAVSYLRGFAPEGRFELRVPTVGLSNADIAISPDGQILATVAKPNSSESSSLYVRHVGAVAFQKLGGTDDSALPFFSPDSRYIGFVAGGRLKKVAVTGGAPQDLAAANGFSGGAWSADGTILFGSPKGIFRVSAEGGQTSQITSLADGQETGHFWPSFLPDGKHFLYLAWSGQPANRAVYAGRLDSKDKTKVMAGQSNAEYAAPGYVVFHREGSLFAQPFDPKKLALSGEAVHLADEVSATSTMGHGNFDVSQNGSLVYFQGGSGPSGRGRTLGNAHYGFVDRRGGAAVGAGETGPYGDFDLSPDGKLVAVTKQDAGASGADIWVIDWQRAGVATQLTLDPGDDVDPVWAPNGKRIAFTSYRKGNADIYVKNADGTGPETPLLETTSDEMIKDWSKDGKYIAYLSRQDSFNDIWALPMDGDKPSASQKPFPVVQGKYQKFESQFSYDGKWLAYTSDESGGRFEVYVTSFPAVDKKRQISMAGGGQPRWRKDGKELYFRALDNTIMIVTFKNGDVLEPSSPAVLFNPPRRTPLSQDPNRHQLSVTPDGQTFLLMVGTGVPGPGGTSTGGVPQAQQQASTNSAGGGGAAPPQGAPGNPSSGLTVIQHWTSALGKAKK